MNRVTIHQGHVIPILHAMPAERWQTPPEIFDPLMAEFSFDLDAAADHQTRRLPYFLCDALSAADWPGKRIWLNPPYGRKLEPFVRRAADEADKGKLVVALIPFRCRAAWWHESVIGRASEVRCVRKRIKFMHLDGSRGKFTGSCDSCIVVWRGGRQPTILTGMLCQAVLTKGGTNHAPGTKDPHRD